MNATVNFYFDTRLNKETQEGIVKFFVTWKRIQRPYSSKIKITQKDWEKLQRNISNEKLSAKLTDAYFIDLFDIIYGEKSAYIHAKNITEQLGSDFDFDKFKTLFYNRNQKSIIVVKILTVQDVFNEIIKSLLNTEQVKTRRMYETVVNHLSLYLSILKSPFYPIIADLKFEHITVEFLQQYEKWMLKFGKFNRHKNTYEPLSITSVGIYMRHLRFVYNEAISTYKTVSNELYPFSKKGYQIPASGNTKVALPKTDIQTLTANISEYPSIEHRSEQLWLFSYIANGMNFTDICRLKWTDIENNTISFYRQKTIKTQKVKRQISVILRPELQEIINQYGTDPKSSVYVFPFINESMNEETKVNQIEYLIKTTNKYIRRTFEKLGLPPKLSTYHARHSFATILMRANVPIKFISDSLGHASLKTTTTYLHSFEDDQKQDFINHLL